jgi:hypothetical protein
VLADADRSRRRTHLNLPHPFQVVNHAVGGLVAVVRFLLQQMQDDLRQRPRYRRVHLRRRCWHPRQVIVGEAQRVPGAERRFPRGQLVQRRAQRVEVGPLVHRPAGAPGLLRCEIGQRPHDLGVVGELWADLGERGRQREIDQARDTVAGDHDVGRGDVAVHHTPPVHPRHRLGQPHRQPDQDINRQRLGQPRQAGAPDVRQHDGPRVSGRLQLRYSRDVAQPLQHGPLVPQPALGVRPQRLLPDDRAPSQEQPTHARAFALVQYLGPRISARQHPACPHPTPPRPAGPGSHMHGRTRLTQCLHLFKSEGDSRKTGAHRGDDHEPEVIVGDGVLLFICVSRRGPGQ